MNDYKGYYKTLGIEPSASENEIRNSWKKLILKWHPDKWVDGTDEEKKKADEMSKKINEAYSVLSDPDKRKEYDNGSPQEDFSGFGFNPFGGFNPFQQSRRVQKGNDVEVEISLTLEEAYNGIKKEITYQKEVICDSCGGTGSSDGKTHPCPHCNGTGTFVKREQRGFTLFQQMTTCPYCHGTGKEIDSPCTSCNGTGLKYETITQTIDIPNGVFNGCSIGVNGAGGEIKDGIPGNLVINVSIKKDNYFKVDGLNLIHEEEIDIADALIGCERLCKCIDGKYYKLKVPELTKDGTEFKVYGLGMPHVQKQNVKGDYIIKVKYKYPKKLNKKAKDALKEFNNEITK